MSNNCIETPLESPLCTGISRAGYNISPTLDKKQQEREQEAEIYADDYASDWYGMGQTRQKSVREILHAHKCRSILDVSTGRGEAMRMADEIGFEVVAGTETVEALCNDRVKFAYSIDLPFDDNEFELVTCFDVLEHLISDDLISTMRELARVASIKVIVSASETPFFYNGREQHISKRPASEWERLFIEALPDHRVTRIQDAGESPCWAIYA